jgi:hypothetical protein
LWSLARGQTVPFPSATCCQGLNVREAGETKQPASRQIRSQRLADTYDAYMGVNCGQSKGRAEKYGAEGNGGCDRD